MIWLTYRQFRAQLIASAALLTFFVAAYAATGPSLARLYTGSGLAACHAPRSCTAPTNAFLMQMKADAVYPFLYFLGAAILLITPALIGAFWGAPVIAREFEAGTFRLAWNQSVTRTRWTATKLALIASAAVALTGALSLTLTWWASPIDRAGGFPVGTSQLGRFSAQIFDARGVTPMAYAAFAFVLGATAGAILTRTLPAMAVTLLVFTAVQVIVPNLVRPHLAAPVRITTAQLTAAQLDAAVFNSDGHLTVPVLGGGAGSSPDAAGPASLPTSGSWIVANQTVTSAGQVFTLPVVPACQSGTHQQCWFWLASQHLRQQVTYQPAARYWRFQWTESAIFVAASLAISVFCLRWISRSRRNP